MTGTTTAEKDVMSMTNLGTTNFLMMWIGCGAHVMGHGRGASVGQSSGGPEANTDLRWIAPQMAGARIFGPLYNVFVARLDW